MKNLLKRALSLAIALVMVLGMVPLVPVTASAEYSSDVCDGDHTGWTAISGTGTKRIKESGKYYLSGDVSDVFILGDLSVTICLNGHDIANNTKYKYSLYIYTRSNVTLCDCTGQGSVSNKHKYGNGGISLRNDSALNIYDVRFSGYGTAISCGDYSVLHLYDITIATSGDCGIYSFGHVYIHDGTIEATNSENAIKSSHYSGREKTGSLTLSGAPKIGGKGVYLANSASKITADGLTDGAEIYVNASKTGDYYITNSNSADVSKYFKSADSERVIINHDNNKVLLHQHGNWKNGTCVTKGICGLCGAQEGPLEETVHNISQDWTHTEAGHYRTCLYGCGTKFEEAACSGGTATCLEPATCTTCGQAYGQTDPDNHATDETFFVLVDQDFHSEYYSCCDVLKATTEHQTEVQATCQGIARCGICDTSYGQTDASNHTGQLQWVSVDKKTHIQKWSCCGLAEGEATAHQLTYTADGLTISAACDLCKAEGTVTMSMSGGTYNGYSYTAKAASTGIFEGWQPYEKPVFTYCCEDGCKKVGDHEVTMTLGDASVKAPFAVTQKELTVSYVQAYYKSYDGTAALEALDLQLDGIVVYSEGYYAEEWDDVRDDVDVDLSALTATAPDCVPGTYETASVTGIMLVGADAENYTVVEAHDSVPLKDWIGYDGLTIDTTSIWIFPEDQQLEGDEQPDQTAYTVEGLEEQFDITGIALYDNGYGKIAVDTSAIVITEDGADVTEYFYIDTYNANLARVCQGHETDANGFCSTGSCEAYEEANLITETDEWGGEHEVYQIWNAGQLYWFAEQVNKYGNGSINGRLMTNIVVNEDLTAENLREWTPIGRNYPAFTGSFDGQGYAVSGLYFSDPEADYVGLFGYTDYGYSISNVHLTDSYFEADSNVGGIFGYACSYISNCTVSDTVTVKGFSNVGGMVGASSYGELSNCWSAATVIATDHEDVPAYYVGGLVGYNCLTVSNCYTTADKLAGVNREDYNGSLTNCYYLSETETEDGGKTAAQFASGEVAYLLQGDQEDHVWGQEIGKDTYPVLDGMKVYKLYDGTYSNTDVAALVGTTRYATVQEAADNANGGFVKLVKASGESVTVEGDLYMDLNGYELAALTVTNGKLYGMDSTTDDYDCTEGYGTIDSFTGEYETQHKTNITGATRRYVAIAEEGVLSFHRIYVGVTHMSLKAGTVDFGYKAGFYGDDMIKKYITEVGFDVWAIEDNKQTLTLTGEDFVSGSTGNTKTLRIVNVMTEAAGDAANTAALTTVVYADAFATLTVNGQVIEIESATVSSTLKTLLEKVNDDTSVYTAEQLSALKALIELYSTAIENAGCAVENILK